MKITLDIPDNSQSDIVALAADMKLPLEKVVFGCMAAGCQVIMANPKLKERVKQQLGGQQS
jgi:hypothetical protein